jgi:hypothetical protein
VLIAEFERVLRARSVLDAEQAAQCVVLPEVLHQHQIASDLILLHVGNPATVRRHADAVMDSASSSRMFSPGRVA